VRREPRRYAPSGWAATGNRGFARGVLMFGPVPSQSTYRARKCQGKCSTNAHCHDEDPSHPARWVSQPAHYAAAATAAAHSRDPSVRPAAVLARRVDNSRLVGRLTDPPHVRRVRAPVLATEPLRSRHRGWNGTLEPPRLRSVGPSLSLVIILVDGHAACCNSVAPTDRALDAPGSRMAICAPSEAFRALAIL
jgi:hypothetical protein